MIYAFNVFRLCAGEQRYRFVPSDFSGGVRFQVFAWYKMLVIQL